MKKLLLITSLLSLQTAIGSCCSSCPTPKVETKKKRAKIEALPVENAEVSTKNVVEAEVAIEEVMIPEMNEENA